MGLIFDPRLLSEVTLVQVPGLIEASKPKQDAFHTDRRPRREGRFLG